MKYLLALVATLVLITCNELTNPEDYEVYYGEEIPNTRILWSPRIAFSPLYANPKVSPDGNYIIYSNKIESGGSISSFYITNLSEIYPQRFSMERIGGPSWSPDSKSIIYQMDWDLYKKNIYTNEIQRITKTEQGNYYRFGMFSSDGESILYIYYNENDGIHGLGIIENDNVNTKLFAKGIIGGYDLGLTYPKFANHALIAVTEQRTKEEIDALVQEMGALHA